MKKLIAKHLLSISSVFRPDDPLHGQGIISPVYCDNRLTLSDLGERYRIGLSNLSEHFPETEAT